MLPTPLGTPPLLGERQHRNGICRMLLDTAAGKLFRMAAERTLKALLTPSRRSHRIPDAGMPPGAACSPAARGGTRSGQVTLLGGADGKGDAADLVGFQLFQASARCRGRLFFSPTPSRPLEPETK